ncbi:MAG: hypothetical protein ACE5HB_03220 [Terriglobia bacterium]
MARAIAAMQTTLFGLGGGAHRKVGYEGPAASLWLGAFSRRLAREMGGFDEALFRSEDNDFYQRIRSRGGRLYLSARIRATYVCRATLGALARQYLVTGTEIMPTLVRNPRAFGWRHLAPGAALIGLLALVVLARGGSPYAVAARWLMACAAAVYVGALLGTAWKGARRAGASVFLPSLAVCFTLHIMYGIGTLAGVIKLPFARRRQTSPGSVSRAS